MDPVRKLLNRTIVPRSLFMRSLLIVVLPMIVLQLVLTLIFYNRYWDTVTRWLAAGVAGDVAICVELMERATTPQEQAAAIDLVRRHTDLKISFEPGGKLDAAMRETNMEPGFLAHIDNKIIEAFAEGLSKPFAIDLRPETPGRIAVYVQLSDGLLRVLSPTKRVTATTTGLLLAWMIGASVALAVVALYFMRLQVHPIRKLAQAMESFGKNRDVGDFEPRGATETRRAAVAFNMMRRRIIRHISQRTEVLAAVSHDLRTPLTRMKLELELIGGADQVVTGLRTDVEEMQALVESYLSFARGEGREVIEPTPLPPILEAMRERAERSGVTLEIRSEKPITLPLRPLAFRRCLANLVDNACRYARWVGITATHRGHHVEIAVEDDGPGIPHERRDAILQPFARLDRSRSRQTGGLGLGMAIARDVVLGHGGEMILGDSSRGGLKVLLRLPE